MKEQLFKEKMGKYCFLFLVAGRKKNKFSLPGDFLLLFLLSPLLGGSLGDVPVEVNANLIIGREDWALKYFTETN